VRRALEFFRADFTYTLQPPPLGLHSVDDFLFVSRRGFCEHYAGSLVFLLRAAGVPARVVTGYLGGETNPLDGHIVVRQADAHAWAEVWLGPTAGWVRVDPTAAIAPARVERGLGSALPAGELPPALARLSLPVLKTLRQTWEMLNNRWDQWVLGYGQSQQLQLLARLAPHLASLGGLTLAASLAGLLGLGLLALSLWRRMPAPTTDVASRAWRRVQKRLTAVHLPPLPGEGPQAYMERVLAARPDLATQTRDLLQHYLLARYAGKEENARTLARLAARFRPARRPRPSHPAPPFARHEHQP
jgi:hypothetical protein